MLNLSPGLRVLIPSSLYLPTRINLNRSRNAMAILSTSRELVSPNKRTIEGPPPLLQTFTRSDNTQTSIQTFTVTLGSGKETGGADTSYVAPAPVSSGISQAALGGIIGAVVGAIILLVFAWACCGRVRMPKLSSYGSSTSGSTSGSSSGGSGSSGRSEPGSEMEEAEWVDDGGQGPRPMQGGPPMPPAMPWGGAPPGAFPMGRGMPPGMARGMPMPMPMGMGNPMGHAGPPPPMPPPPMPQ
ncbi:hypothetical protein BJ166DRAFT_107556 [Pestalotiopsis sp. NC0098]|nr:hypothetical protein BJ166DRAFT_107556 [Pestalotiopsis sp. NC0098]